jgi:peptidoglycan/LPS O-acetylase OafA/YrhL
MLYKLESLRGVAALFVVLYHCQMKFGNFSFPFIQNSYLFVDFFFVLSGFVMSLAYGVRIQSGLPFKAYIVSRLGRLYPLHITLLFVWLIYLLSKQALYVYGYGGSEQFDEYDSFKSFFTHVFLIQSFGINAGNSWNVPSWSISAELFAYIFFFAFSFFIDKKNKIMPCIIIAVTAYLFLVSLGRDSLGMTYDYGLIRCIGAFYLGVALHRIQIRIKNLSWSIKYIYLLELIAVTLLVVTVNYASISSYAFMPALLAFMFAIFVFSSTKDGLIGGVLNNQYVRLIGLWSYSIYMVHSIVISITQLILEYVFNIIILEFNSLERLSFSVFVISVTIFLASLTYRYIEVPFRDKAKQYSKQLSMSKLNS